MITGSCLCGEVTWRAEGPFSEPEHCHCSICRKVHGAPFASFVSCAADRFAWTGGEGAIRRYQSSPDLVRPFCGTCGSALPSEVASTGEVYLPLGGTDGDPGLRGGHHIFVASKAPFHLVGDRLARHDRYPSGVSVDALPVETVRSALDPPVPGVLRGSCKCSAIAFEVLEPFTRVFNCHCSRCRKARAAAHATNGFVSADGVRFLRGEEMIRVFRLPGAASFGQAFCRRCGSGMPRLNREHGVFTVPLGCLDDDPGRGADFHIFTAYKAPWYEIEDGIPQLPEGPS
jgi:hypothetical protein